MVAVVYTDVFRGVPLILILYIPPEKIFSSPENQRTARFLRRVIEAGRL